MSLIKKGELVFDIGANIGQSALLYVKAGAGHVVSVEPAFQNFVVLRELQSDRVTPIMAACGVCWGFSKIYYSTTNPGLSTTDVEKWSKLYDGQFRKPQMVVCITLDMLKLKYGQPSYVKVDVEGQEYEVLAGMNFKPDYLSFEFHGEYENDRQRCLERLIELGYTKFCYTINDHDLETEPFLTSAELKDRLAKEKPGWGNVTAC